MSSPPTSPLKSRPRRESRFTEGSYITPSSIPSYTTPLSLQTILFEMDEHERALRKRGDSHSSVESFQSSNNGSSPREVRRSEDVGQSTFGRRSATWNSRRSEDHGREREREEGLASKVKGRLRAFTGERRRDVKGSPYPGN